MTLKKQKVDSGEFDNISITAFRIISILNMLLVEPLSDEEINQKLQENIKGARSLSKDTISIYINTLRAIGCEITRSSKKNNYKYVLKSHPFNLNLSNEEVNTFIEMKKYISSLGNWKLSLETDDLLNKIVDIITPENKKKYLDLKSIVLCREINIENLLNELNLIENYCNKNSDILIIYDSPSSGEKNIYLKAEKITLENGAFYLWGYNYELDETSYLRFDRIKSVEPAIMKERKEKEGFMVKYKLTGISAYSFHPCPSCRIIEKKRDNELVIEAKVTNKFKFIQEIMSYGFDCTVLSPETIRQEVIQKLKMMIETNKDVFTL